MRRHLVLVALLAACAPPRFQARPLTPDATGLFARAESGDVAGAAVLDLDGFRELGFLDPKAGDAQLADVLIGVLPAVALEADPEVARLAARAAVMVGLLRDAVDWPSVLRIGVFAPALGRNPKPLAVAESVVLALAVDAPLERTRELLSALAAADRAGGPPVFARRGDDLCLSRADVPLAICLRPGPGYLLLATPVGLSRLGAVVAKPPAASDLLAHVRVDVPGVAKGEVRATGRAAVDLSVDLELPKARDVEKVEREILDALRETDERLEKSRALLAPELDRAKAALAADPDAPAALKAQAAAMTLDRLVDRDGSWAALRQSITIRRQGTRLQLALRVPERTVREASQQGSLLAAAAVAGIAAAVAIPNFTKFDCRSKQSEAKANLKALYTAWRAFEQEKDRAPDSFDEMGFAPEPGTRYSYCTAFGCLACTRAGCGPASEDDNPCAGMAAAHAEDDDEVPWGCAAGRLGSDDDELDVWIIESDGQPQNVFNGCE